MTLSEVFKRLDISGNQAAGVHPVYIGGPVETQRGFVLHSDKQRLSPDALVISGAYVLTATQDILAEIGGECGPDPYLFALGYSGWGAGQLEGEIAQNGWLTAQASQDIVFGTDPDLMWETALRSNGIDPVTLSGTAGRA
ncbi:UNVERIFIED_CONTAM: hypothetical protein GTU68_041632 [Idotea baltica]|nr:hypothetical protein [Idotea baltica]